LLGGDASIFSKSNNDQNSESFESQGEITVNRIDEPAKTETSESIITEVVEANDSDFAQLDSKVTKFKQCMEGGSSNQSVIPLDKKNIDDIDVDNKVVDAIGEVCKACSKTIGPASTVTYLDRDTEELVEDNGKKDICKCKKLAEDGISEVCTIPKTEKSLKGRIGDSFLDPLKRSAELSDTVPHVKKMKMKESKTVEDGNRKGKVCIILYKCRCNTVKAIFANPSLYLCILNCYRNTE